MLQRAIVLILERLYEPLFHPHSFGYRPGRSAHQALGLLYQQLGRGCGGHIVEVDIQGFFDHLDKRRLRAFLQQRCRANRHRPLPEQHAALCRKVRGYYAYFGIRGNSAAISRFRYAVEYVWTKWLRRRSQRHRLDGERAVRLLRRYSLPPARLITMKPANVMS